jgi:2-dehydropantoate 2-reductase
MTFGHELDDLATYFRIPFILDSGGTPFHQLLPGPPNPSFTIPAAERPYYHALCVMAGNFSTILWLKLFDELEVRFGIPGSGAHQYLAQMAANLLTDAGRSLTGPLSRGDSETIDANLKALDGDPFHGIYHAFVRVYEQRS